MTTPQRFKVHQIRHLLPADSWWLSRKDLNDENVHVYEGELTLDTLSLDFEKDVPSSDLISLIVVRGNLTIAGDIHSGDDGSVSLMVTGDLRARNLCIGGQELYVHGDVHVAEVFAGSYNHGETIVLGSISALVYVQDEEYRVKAAKGSHFTYSLRNHFGFGFWNGIPFLADEIILPGFLDEGTDDGDPYTYIGTYSLHGNGSILRDPVAQREGLPAPRIAPLVSSPAISAASIEMLTKTVLMPREGERVFQFKEGGVTYRVSAGKIDDSGKLTSSSVFLEDAQAQYLFYYLEENQFVCVCKRLDGGEWTPVIDMQSAEARQLFTHWVNLLKYATVAQHYFSRMPKAELESFFHKARTFEMDEEWWFGDLHFRLRHAYTKADGKHVAPMLRIQTPGENPSFYTYYLFSQNWIECDMQENEAASSVTIPFDNVRLMETAARYYKVFQLYMRLKLIPHEN